MGPLFLDAEARPLLVARRFDGVALLVAFLVDFFSELFLPADLALDLDDFSLVVVVLSRRANVMVYVFARLALILLLKSSISPLNFFYF